ncbi:hypothetical protein IWW36_003336 [Coemansia brasiliensis]|uniref:alpha,alpha-trehalase n=1 Tax=Coemansia brasiliensis TaxID=2650707 RepID=A0A9W8LYM7_9FUNG|nr:hypothetical protein IWW36_003336 [Coemansia brasiliensis]
MKLQTFVGWAVASTAATAMASKVDTYLPPKVTVVGQREQQMLCDHPIYCNGPLLSKVMLSGVFDKDKSFVDMPTRKPLNDVLAAFNSLPSNATKSQIASFVDENFYPAGYDVVEAELDDWTDTPPFLDGVADPVLRGYGMSVHNQWKKLARKHDPTRLCDGCVSSLLATNHTFIVSGGAKSREFTYWDTYYINLGLLQSGLYKTARGVLGNLLDMIRLYGFVPTGGRVYFTDRSGLPLLALMVKDYYEATLDLTLVAEALPLLVKEHEFWDTYRSINITYTPNSSLLTSRKRQNSPGVVTSKITTPGPDLFSTAGSTDTAVARPENYLADTATSKTEPAGPDLFDTALKPGDFYAATEAGTMPSVQYANSTTAEIGPSLFTTALRRRSLDIPTTNPFASFTRDQLLVLGSVGINDTVAVNINSILYQTEIAIASFYELLHNNTHTKESLHFRDYARNRQKVMVDLTYNPQTGLFADYHIHSGEQSNVWTINSLWSYWAFSDQLPAKSTQQGLDSLRQLHAKFPGGLPNTYYNTSLLWDWPNVQTPMQHMAIRSASSIEKLPQYRKRNEYGSVSAGIAQSTLGTAFCNWYTTGGSISDVLNPYDHAPSNSSGASFGSYAIGADGNIDTTTDASDPGNYAWTNGVVLWIFDQYKPQIQIPKCPNVKLNIIQHPTPTPTPTPSPTYLPPPSSSLPPKPTQCTPRYKCKHCKCRLRRRRSLKQSNNARH